MEKITSEYLCASQRLHNFLSGTYWDGEMLIGPDQGVRFNRRYWRFVKSYLSFLHWKDNYYYLQAQAYWVLSNWQLYDLIGEEQLAEMAINCAYGIRKSQQLAGYWEYPHPGWTGRIATVEVAWAALGMLASYERTKQMDLLEGVFKAYDFLVKHTGFQEAGDGYAINYFSSGQCGLVPNNTTLALAFFGRLSQVSGDKKYLLYCPGMIAFLTSVQLASGEFPYELRGAFGRNQFHFQCYQYNAFELQDLAMYYKATQDETILPLIAGVVNFLVGGIKDDGSIRFDCNDRSVEIVYNIAAVAGALGIARRMGISNTLEAENRTYAYVLAQQRANGGFAFSNREHSLLRDTRYYPRPLTMILYHLLLKACESCAEIRSNHASMR
jgi:hypothetical protein